MTDVLAEATLQLDSAASSISSGDPEAQEAVRASLTACLAALRSVTGEAERAAVLSLDLVRLHARAAENLDLADLSLERSEGAQDSRMGDLQRALFHAHRAVDYFQRYLETLTERTRAVDRERNRQEFMSG
jgi:hypothetical protein